MSWGATCHSPYDGGIGRRYPSEQVRANPFGFANQVIANPAPHAPERSGSSPWPWRACGWPCLRVLAESASICPRGGAGGCFLAVARGAGVIGFGEAAAAHLWRPHGLPHVLDEQQELERVEWGRFEVEPLIEADGLGVLRVD